VVNDAVDGGGRGHRIFEDLVPLTEDQIASDDHGASLIALGHEGKEDFDFFSALLHVAEVIEDDDVNGIEAAQRTRKCQVSLGGEQLLDELKGGSEEDGVTVLHEGVTECAGSVSLAGAGQAEAEHVGGALEEVTALELAQSGQHAFGEALRVEGFERFRRW
jgi:hypothetical protein